MYNRNAVNDDRNIAPRGWHIPSDTEWHTLISYLDPNATLNNDNESLIAGGMLKEEVGTTHWIYPNTGATNESKFTGFPGGARLGIAQFYYLNMVGYWWTTTRTSEQLAWCRCLIYFHPYAMRIPNGVECGLSVRCIKD